MKNIVLFDIDYTLFDSVSYRNAFIKDLADLAEDTSETFFKIAEEEYFAARKISHNFDPDIFLARVNNRLEKSIDIALFKKLLSDEKKVSQHLYSETIEVLQKLAKNPELILGVFSAGMIDIQKPKIKAIEKLFDPDHIYIFDAKKILELPSVLRKYAEDRVYIVDDILDILRTAKANHPNITTIWIKRGFYKDTQNLDNFVPDSIIQSLEELPNIIR